MYFMIYLRLYGDKQGLQVNDEVDIMMLVFC